MSGICAIVDRRPPAGDTRALDIRLGAMLDRLAHRGPDGTGIAVDGPCALGQALLATTDEELPVRQPVRSAGGRLLLVADARLDNREDLFARGAFPGARSADVSDARLILWAYERWGERCPAHLVGDFAFVVWDREARRLFAARDPIGVRPLYYHLGASELRCASEMNALFADERLARRHDRLSVGLYLAGEYEEQDRTLYQDVHVLAAAHSLTVTADAVRVVRFWQPDGQRLIQHRSDEEHAEHFRPVLEQAVRSRLRASGPIAAEASGGLDSSSVIGLSEVLRRSGRGRADPVSLVTMRYTEWPGCDEGEWAQAVADYWDLPLIELSANGQPERRAPALRNLPPDFLYDAGILDGLREFEMCRAEGIRVVLTGIGGDDVLRVTGLELGSALRRGRLGAALTMAGVRANPWFAPGWRALLRAVPSALAPRLRDRLARKLGRPRRRAPSWLTGTVASEVEAALAARDGARAGWTYRSASHRWRCEHFAYLGDIQPNLGLVQTLATGCQLELRHPWLDLRVVEHLLALPDEQLASLSLNKPILRRSLGAALPPAIHGRRSQQETSCYYERAFLADHQSEVRSLLETSRLGQAGIIDIPRVWSMLDAPAEHIRDLHTIVSMELWLRQTRLIGQLTDASENSHGNRADGR